MKKFRKSVSIISALCLLIALFVPMASAQEKTGQFKAFCYNVSGLPDFSSLSGGVTVEGIIGLVDNQTMHNQTAIGKYIEEKSYDIVAVQENFFYNDFLAKELKSYKYATEWLGGVPSGDGLSTFTKSMKLTGETHTVWEKLSGDGSAQDGADIYSRKGILYTCVEIENGVYIDFYNIHADAFGDPGSKEARRDNFRQLIELIEKKNTGRAVIITGDFNISAHHAPEDDGLIEYLIDRGGFKDAWIELYNDGNYRDFSKYIQSVGASYEAYWGKWDSVEKFLYRDGKDIKISCDSFDYISEIVNEDGARCSDHNAIAGTFTYTVSDGASQDNGESASLKETKHQKLFRNIFSFLKSLVLGLSNIRAIIDNLFK